MTRAANSPSIEAALLRALCLEAGADDVGFVELERPALAAQQDAIQQLFGPTRALVSLAFGANYSGDGDYIRTFAGGQSRDIG